MLVEVEMPVGDAFLFGHIVQDFVGGGKLVVYLVEVGEQDFGPVPELVGGAYIFLVFVPVGFPVGLVEQGRQFGGIARAQQRKFLHQTVHGDEGGQETRRVVARTVHQHLAQHPLQTHIGQHHIQMRFVQVKVRYAVAHILNEILLSHLPEVFFLSSTGIGASRPFSIMRTMVSMSRSTPCGS